MSTWKYEFKDYYLHLEDTPQATYTELPGTSPLPDVDYLLAEVDAEVHRLTALIQKSEYEIYKLRKWQKVIKKKET